MKKSYKFKWQKVRAKRNSHMGVDPKELDWSNWWVDNSFNDFYLHVQHKSEGTVHRVYCKATKHPAHGHCRLGMKNGELYWILD